MDAIGSAFVIDGELFAFDGNSDFDPSSLEVKDETDEWSVRSDSDMGGWWLGCKLICFGWIWLGMGMEWWFGKKIVGGDTDFNATTTDNLPRDSKQFSNEMTGLHEVIFRGSENFFLWLGCTRKSKSLSISPNAADLNQVTESTLYTQPNNEGSYFDDSCFLSTSYSRPFLFWMCRIVFS